MKQNLIQKLTVPQLGKQIPALFWDPKFQCRVRQTPLTVPILSHINPLHTIYPIYLTSILILSTLLFTTISIQIVSKFSETQ